MKQTFVLIAVLFILLVPVAHAASDTFYATEHAISITNSGSGLRIIEDIKVKNTGIDPSTSIRFWIEQDAQEIKIVATGRTPPLEYTVSGNEYTCNLTQYNLTVNNDKTLQLQVSYNIPLTTKYFDKTLSYSTSSLTVSFNSNKLFSGKELSEGSSYNLLLYMPSNTPLDLFSIVAVTLLVVFLIVVTLLLLKNQRRKRMASITESDELLSTKKAILLSALKDLEKQHRAKTISDDTFTKLKEEYKQQAVEVMKKIDDLGH